MRKRNVSQSLDLHTDKQPMNDLNVWSAVYRFSFCRTYAEMQAPTGEWKSVTAGVLALVASAFWIYVWLKKYGMCYDYRGLTDPL